MADQNQNPELTQEQMLQQILENTRKTRNYIKWQMIITIAFVVIPLLGSLLVIPYALKSLTAAYSGAGLF